MCPTTLHRPYRDDDDYLRMRRFLQDGWRQTGLDGGLFHVGDLTWQRFMYSGDVQRPEDVFGLWENEGTLVGFTVYYPKWREASLQIDPRLWGSETWAGIAGEMIAWADERQAVNSGAEGNLLTIYERETRADAATYLTSRGFARAEHPPMRFHRQSLAGPVPEPVLPQGFAVRAVREDELEDRVMAHREVWHPSRFTLESYRAVRAAPGYDPELDIVALAPDGTIGAYAICWHDEANHHGLFEPVGAREAYRGRNLAKAVLHEAMRRLRERGCTHAFVYTTEDREPACRLYLSAGFEVIDRWVAYQRADSL